MSRASSIEPVASWRMLPASEPTLAASATTVIAAPALKGREKTARQKESGRIKRSEKWPSTGYQRNVFGLRGVGVGEVAA